MSLDINKEAIKEKIKEDLQVYQPKMVIYNFRIDKEILDGAKKEAAGLSISTADFIRQAIVEKMDNKARLSKLEERIEKLENSK